MKSPLVFIAFVCGIFCACNGAATSNATYEGDTLALRYAQQLSLVQYKGYVQATLANPWKKGAVLHSYVLVPKGRVGDSLLQHDAQLQAGKLPWCAHPLRMRWFSPRRIAHCFTTCTRSRHLAVYAI